MKNLVVTIIKTLNAAACLACPAPSHARTRTAMSSSYVECSDKNDNMASTLGGPYNDVEKNKNSMSSSSVGSSSHS